MTDRVPPFLFERLLFGVPGSDEIERFTQDGGIGREVWMAFANDIRSQQQLLLTPVTGLSGVKLASALHRALKRYASYDGVVPLDNYVIAKVELPELIGVIIPLTPWWTEHQLDRLVVYDRTELLQRVYNALLRWLANDFSDVARARLEEDESGGSFANLVKAAPIIVAIGIFGMVYAKDFKEPMRRPASLLRWIQRHLKLITARAMGLLIPPEAYGPQEVNVPPFSFATEAAADGVVSLINRAFLDRRAELATTEGLSTIKADAASRLFDVKCSSLTWAVIDSGIDASHPAFLDRKAASTTSKPKPSRVRAAYDFSRFDAVRNYKLTMGDTPEAREVQIRNAYADLLKVPGRYATPEYEAVAIQNLRLIAKQLDADLEPDWELIEPLLRLPQSDGTELGSDHGTLVAGVLGADWDRGKASPIRGVCPDINIIDLRIMSRDVKSTESAVIAALEFVRFLNRREFNQNMVVAGVNVSLSIPYDPKRYGCGATPVCTAADRLSNSGVVVVVAAGNRGWSRTDEEERLPLEDPTNNVFNFCSITDPGNAHEVITVGATHRQKPHLYGVSFFSSRGPTGDGRIKPDVVAPGEKILGPIRGAGSAERDGTSFAAPFVSGAAAMLLARHPELLGNPRLVKKVICETATDLGRERYFQGHGLVDVLRALQHL